MRSKSRHRTKSHIYPDDRWYLALLSILWLAIIVSLGCFPIRDTTYISTSGDSDNRTFPPNGCIGQPYHFDLNSALSFPRGFMPPFTFQPIESLRDIGLDVDPNTGIISGVPNEEFEEPVLVIVTSNTGELYNETIAFSFGNFKVISSPLSYDCNIVGYIFDLEVCGGNLSFTWEIEPDEDGYDESCVTLMENLDDSRQRRLLAEKSCMEDRIEEIEGESLDQDFLGDYTFNIKVTDNTGISASHYFSIPIYNYSTFIPRTLPYAYLHESYAYQLDACTSQWVDDRWSLISGELPIPIPTVSEDGRIETPENTAIEDDPGVYPFRVRNFRSWGDGYTISATIESYFDFSLTVVDATPVMLDARVDARECLAVDEDLNLRTDPELSGGTWPTELDTLPGGLELDDEGRGILSGRPTLPNEENEPHVFVAEVSHASPDPHRIKEVTVSVYVAPDPPDTPDLQIVSMDQGLSGPEHGNVVYLSLTEDIKIEYELDSDVWDRAEDLIDWSRTVTVIKLGGDNCNVRPLIDTTNINIRRNEAIFTVNEFEGLVEELVEEQSTYDFRLRFSVYGEDPDTGIKYDETWNQRYQVTVTPN